MGLPFPFSFLSLPADMRVEIYRYCLRSPTPINFSSGKRRIQKGEKSAVALLRTCQQLKSECREVLYGENHCYFWKDPDYLEILHYLPRSNFNWIKELTMPVPFAGFEGCNGWEEPRSFERQARHIHTFRVDFERNRAIKQLLDAIINATELRRLNLTIDTDFRYTQNTDMEYRSTNEDAWEDLAALLRIKKSLKVTVTRLVSSRSISAADELNQQRFLRALRWRLGIWDVHDVTVDDDPGTDWWIAEIHWKIPAEPTEEDPDEYLCQVRALFEGRS
jgi:hypothetical protein